MSTIVGWMSFVCVLLEIVSGASNAAGGAKKILSKDSTDPASQNKFIIPRNTPFAFLDSAQAFNDLQPIEKW